MMKRYLMSAALVAASTLSAQTTVYDAIASHVLKSLPAPTYNTDEPKNKESFAFPDPSEYETTRTLLAFLSQTEPAAHDHILNTTVAQDLNFFYYDEKQPDKTLLNRMYGGATHLGKCAFARLLQEPIEDIAALEKRQQLIKWFIDNPAVTEELEGIFAAIAESERLLLSLWDNDDPLWSQFVSKRFFGGSLKKYEGTQGGARLEAEDRAGHLLNLSLVLAMSYIAGGGKITGTLDYFRKGDYAVGGMMTVLQVLGWMKMIERLRAQSVSYSHFVPYVHKRFAPLVAFVEQVQRLVALVEQHPDLAELLPDCAAMKDFDPASGSTTSRALNLFPRGTATTGMYPFIQTGSVLHALPLFAGIRNRFGPVFKSLGYIEAMMSAARLYERHRDERVPFCFPEYVVDASGPRVSLEGVWHPMVPAESVVSNDVSLGAGFNGMVITGPNAGGKTTAIKATVLALVMGQSFGIVPAKRAQFTPFSKITTYLNIVDRLDQGDSLFMAEVRRAEKLFRTLDVLPEDKYAFTALDEVFSSTAPRVGSAAALGVLREMANYPNNLIMLATHFSQLTTLPRFTDGFYRNYKVTAERDGSGPFTMPYKLVEGVSDQFIALDLMELEGFSEQVLAEARAFMARHEEAGL